MSGAADPGRVRRVPRRLAVAGLAVLLLSLPAAGSRGDGLAAPVRWSVPTPVAHLRDEAGPWSPLTILPIIDPSAFGAVGDGKADDTVALQAAVDGLPPGGGVVWLPPGRRYRLSDLIWITKDHVKLWAPEDAELVSDTDDAPRRQALIIENTIGVGLYGLRLSSDATDRRYALEDSAVAIVDATDTEVMGLDISNSAAPAIFVFDGSERTYVRGNTIHDTWADSIHFTDGSRQAWVWGNTFHTAEPRPGDDGIACVTYGSAPRCGEMEWWHNVHLGNDWGRGLSVVGGEDIEIHHNLVMNTAGAGILVASEPSYDTPGSDRISIHDNVVIGAGRVIPHPGVLLSGLEEPITNVTVHNNTVLATVNGEAFRVEGEVEGVDEQGTVTDADPREAQGDQVLVPVDGASRVLGTFDTSFVAAAQQPGLHRIRIRPVPGGVGFQQQFEYLVVGSMAEVEGWLALPGSTFVVFRGSTGSDEAVALVRTDQPLTIPAALRSLSFAELRSDRRWRELPGLWAAVDKH